MPPRTQKITAENSMNLINLSFEKNSTSLSFHVIAHQKNFFSSFPLFFAPPVAPSQFSGLRHWHLPLAAPASLTDFRSLLRLPSLRKCRAHRSCSSRLSSVYAQQVEVSTSWGGAYCISKESRFKIFAMQAKIHKAVSLLVALSLSVLIDLPTN